MSKGLSVSDAAGLASDGQNMAWEIFKGVRDTIDRQRKRYKMGILYPDENRDTLVTQGKIPPVYSSEIIRMNLADNNLPPNWTAYTTVLQGFSKDVINMEKRLSNDLRLARQLQQAKIEEARERVSATYKNKINELYGRKMSDAYKLL